MWWSTHPVSVVALSQGTLPGKSALNGYVAYTAPSIPSFINGTAAMYVRWDLPQRFVDTQSMSSAEREKVAVEETISKKVTTLV